MRNYTQKTLTCGNIFLRAQEKSKETTLPAVTPMRPIQIPVVEKKRSHNFEEIAANLIHNTFFSSKRIHFRTMLLKMPTNNTLK